VTTEPNRTVVARALGHFVAEQNPETAPAIIAAMMATEREVEAWGRLSGGGVKRSDESGDFTHG